MKERGSERLDGQREEDKRNREILKERDKRGTKIV